MDIYEEKNIKPMLIGKTAEAFDSSDYIYELKLDGERCVAYLDPKMGTELRNKRNMKMLTKVPELSNIHLQVKERCILDGELIVVVDGKPDFFEIQRRSLTANEFKIHLHSLKYPASFIAFDILYLKDKEIISLPLTERKKLLDDTVEENERLAISRHIEKHGMDFYKLTEEQGLEGIVAKKKNSRYYFDKRSKDWLKIKNLQDDDFVVCGYIEKPNSIISIVLGQYDKNNLVNKGHVTLGISTGDFQIISSAKRLSEPPFTELSKSEENAVWLKPEIVCKVKYMMKTSTGSMRQPVFQGIRFDKEPHECKVNP